MRKEKEIQEIVELLGANDYERGKDWKGMQVFIPVYNKMSYVGFPLVIFKEDGGYRLSTDDEALEYINATTDSSEIDVDEKKGKGKSFFTFKKQ